MKSKTNPYLTGIPAAAAGGLLLSLSFPHFEWYWLAWVAFVPLFYVLREASVKSGFILGWVMGAAHYATLIYWVAYTMRVYGYLPWALCILVLLLFAGFLALFFGAFGAAATRLARRPSIGVVALPALWVSLEFIRSFLFTGFPWELLGHSQYRFLPLIQISDLSGVYGISFLVMLCNTAVFLLLLLVLKQTWQGRLVTVRLVVGTISTAVLLCGSAFGYGIWRIGVVDMATAAADKSRIAIVQGNIPQSEKWDPEFQVATLKKYVSLSSTTAPQQPELVIWPETAAPFYFNHNKELTALLLDGIRGFQTTFLIGSPSVIRRPNGWAYYNSAYLIDASGRPSGVYHKSHLVPFGEYVPMKEYLPFLGKMVAQVGDFSRGTVGDTISWQQQRLGVLICYELIFSYLARAAAGNEAHLFVNITNDAWYGRTGAPFQHFSMAVFRAVENRRALVRAANTGISGFIDPAGRIVASTGLFEDAVMTRSVPLMTLESTYTRFGDVFAWMCLLTAVPMSAVIGNRAGRFR